jgi:MFS family permease
MTTATLTPESVPLRQDARIIGLIGLAHAISHFSHLLLPPMFPVFMANFDLSFSQVGLLVTLFFVISGSGQMLSGFIVDRVGARPALFVALLMFALAAVFAATATGYTGLVLSAVCAGLGNAPFHPIDYSILNQRVSAPRLGHAYSAHGLSGNLGWALAPAWLVGWSQLFDWRAAYWAAAALYGVVLLVLLLNRDALRTQTVVRAPAGQAQESSVAFLKLPVVWWCFGYFMLSTMTLSVVQSFAPSILKIVHGVATDTASLVLTTYMLCGAAGMLLGGFVAARHAQHSERVVAWAMAAGALLVLAVASAALGASGTMVALALTGFAVGVGGPSRDMMIKRATPKGATGRVYGTVYSGLDVGFALAPLMFGVLMDQGWYGATLSGAAFTLALAVGAALMVGRLSRLPAPQPVR